MEVLVIVEVFPRGFGGVYNSHLNNTLSDFNWLEI